MGYRITYGPVKRKKEKPRRWPVWMAGVAALAVFVRIMGWDEVLLSFLLPGDPAVTAAALENMARSLGDGQGIAEAITGFCREIIGNAQLY